VAESKPGFAAMTLLKALLLPVGMPLDEEDRLMRAALEVQSADAS